MKDINEHNQTINEINLLIESNLNESNYDDFLTFMRGGAPALLTKKAIESLVDGGEDEKDKHKRRRKKKEKEKEKEGLTDKEKEDIDKEIKGLNDTLDKIAEKLGVLQNASQKDLKYKKVEIQFNGKTELDIEKMKSPEFQRNLLGTMFFKVVGINENKKTIDLKTNSFPNTILIRLEYDKLITYREQSGDVHLLYNKYGFVGDRNVAGDEKKITFKFLNLK